MILFGMNKNFQNKLKSSLLRYCLIASEIVHADEFENNSHVKKVIFVNIDRKKILK